MKPGRPKARARAAWLVYMIDGVVCDFYKLDRLGRIVMENGQPVVHRKGRLPQLTGSYGGNSITVMSAASEIQYNLKENEKEVKVESNNEETDQSLFASIGKEEDDFLSFEEESYNHIAPQIFDIQ